MGQQGSGQDLVPLLSPPSRVGELTGDLYMQVSPLLGPSQELRLLWLLVEFPL